MTNASILTTPMDVETLNELEQQKYIGILVFYIILMTIGIIGNLLVLIIYKTKFKRSSARVYILSLALADLSVCIVGIPYHVLDLWLQLTYINAAVCKTLSYLISACSLSSVFILLVVGLDRFLKVCRPLKKQIIDFGDRKACIIATLAACLINIPNGIIYGESSVQVEDYNITGIECFIQDLYVGSGFATGYLGLYVLIFVMSVCYLIVVYGLICRKIYQQDHTNTGITLTKTRYVCFCCIIEKDEAVDDVGIEDVVNEETYGEDTEEDREPMSTLFKKVQDDLNDGSVKCESKKGKPVTRKEKQVKAPMKNTMHKVSSAAMIRHVATGSKRHEKNTRKITLMMLTITIVFIVTYCPFIIISVFDSIDDEFWANITHGETMVADFLLRFYLFNNVANPLIYCFWDGRFRKEVVKVCRRALPLSCLTSDSTGSNTGDSRSPTTTSSTYKQTETHIE